MAGSNGKFGKIPFFAIGNDELAQLPPVHAGQSIKCPAKCGKKHRVENCKDAEGHESTMMQFINCGTKAYLVGIGERKLK